MQLIACTQVHGSNAIYLIQKLSADHLEVYENSIKVLKGCFRSNYKGHILQSIKMLIPIGGLPLKYIKRDRDKDKQQIMNLTA